MATSELYAALVMPTGTQLLIGPFQGFVRNALRAYDGFSGKAPLMLPGRGMIAGDAFCVHIQCDPNAPHGPRVVFTVSAHDPHRADDTAAMVDVLNDIVLRALDDSDAVLVEWLSPAQFVTPESFVKLANAGQTHILPKAAEVPEPCVEEQPDDTAATLRLRLASCAMALTIGALSLPMAAFVMTIGVMRGLNLRLTTHALVLTAVGAMLHQTGVYTGSFPQVLF